MAESCSMKGASDQPVFMGDCLTICNICLFSLAFEWVSFCVPGAIEVSVDAVWASANSGLRYTLLPKLYATLMVMVTGSGNNLFVKPLAGELSLRPEWELDG